MATPVRISLRQSATTLVSDGQQTVLETLEAHQLQVEYQCREGYCGSCRLRLCQGQVAYRSPPLAYVQPGEILACCCQPISDLELDL